MTWVINTRVSEWRRKRTALGDFESSIPFHSPPHLFFLSDVVFLGLRRSRGTTTKSRSKSELPTSSLCSERECPSCSPPFWGMTTMAYMMRMFDNDDSGKNSNLVIPDVFFKIIGGLKPLEPPNLAVEPPFFDVPPCLSYLGLKWLICSSRLQPPTRHVFDLLGLGLIPLDMGERWWKLFGPNPRWTPPMIK